MIFSKAVLTVFSDPRNFIDSEGASAVPVPPVIVPVLFVIPKKPELTVKPISFPSGSIL